MACGKSGTDPAHIKSVGAGGDDHINNLLPLCREHHSEHHQTGWSKFIRKHPQVGYALGQRGWELQNINGVEKLVQK